MSDCRFYKDGKCGKSENCKLLCNPMKPSEFDERFDTYETFEGACADTSLWGNSAVYITEKNIEDLRKGKILMHYDGEYCTFVILKDSERNENRAY